jgi:hypothetical protein
MIELYGDNKVKLSDHVLSTAKINFGIILNMLLIPGFFYGFLVALCLRFDGMIDTSYFILLIPFWIILLPLFIFIILNGMATKNSRANKCEKSSLSVMVPSKNFFINEFSWVFGILYSASFACGRVYTKSKNLLHVDTVLHQSDMYVLVHEMPNQTSEDSS